MPTNPAAAVSSPTAPAKPRRFSSLFPPATHLAYAGELIARREQRAASVRHGTKQASLAQRMAAACVALKEP